MASEDVGVDWQELSAQVFRQVHTWRDEHPQATFAAIEATVHQELERLAAQLVQEVAQASPRAVLQDLPAAARPHCAACGAELVDRGPRERTVTVRGNYPVHLRRSYAVCPSCGGGLFPPR